MHPWPGSRVAHESFPANHCATRPCKIDALETTVTPRAAAASRVDTSASSTILIAQDKRLGHCQIERKLNETKTMRLSAYLAGDLNHARQRMIPAARPAGTRKPFQVATPYILILALANSVPAVQKLLAVLSKTLLPKQIRAVIQDYERNKHRRNRGPCFEATAPVDSANIPASCSGCHRRNPPDVRYRGGQMFLQYTSGHLLVVRRRKADSRLWCRSRISSRANPSLCW